MVCTIMNYSIYISYSLKVLRRTKRVISNNYDVGSIRVNTDDFYTPMFHKPLSLFGRGYSLRYRFLYWRNVISVPCNKRADDIWLGNQTIKQIASDPNSGKYGRGRESTDIDRESTDIYNFH